MQKVQGYSGMHQAATMIVSMNPDRQVRSQVRLGPDRARLVFNEASLINQKALAHGLFITTIVDPESTAREYIVFITITGTATRMKAFWGEMQAVKVACGR